MIGWYSLQNLFNSIRHMHGLEKTPIQLISTSIKFRDFTFFSIFILKWHYYCRKCHHVLKFLLPSLHVVLKIKPPRQIFVAGTLQVSLGIHFFLILLFNMRDWKLSPVERGADTVNTITNIIIPPPCFFMVGFCSIHNFCL